MNCFAIARKRQAGFSLIELMMVLVILVTVSGIVATGLFRMTRTQGTVWNRTETHAAVRSATELLQQEISQAGRIALPPGPPVTLLGAVAGLGASATVSVSSTAGMFPQMKLVIGPDAVSGCPGTQCGSQETVTLTAVGAGTITAVFQDPHAIGAAVNVAGAFAAGLVPPCGPLPIPPCPGGAAAYKSLTVDIAGNPVVTTMTAATGSTGFILKLFGDINDDGNLVYVEYKCDMSTNPGKFTRSVTPFTAGAKTVAQTLLTNLLANPAPPADGRCFDYQTRPIQNNTYVINVTVTLTIQTEYKDPQTNQFQTETKALLNVSPRNVYEAWQLTGSPGGTLYRIQPMPFSVVSLLP